MIQNKKLEIGKFILDNISIGMYNNPLMLYREYIQNSVDSIDEICCTKHFRKNHTKIEINIDGRNRKILIKDNGAGIKAENAWATLFNIGKSNKLVSINRGFRGIGRLGGIGYCDELRFKTKAIGENIYTESIWDTKRLREIINNSSISENTTDIIKEVTEFEQKQYTGQLKDHFFIVEMHNVSSIKDICLDVPEVKSYISQVAPVPFDSNKFSFSEQIEKKLKENVPLYNIYNISVNGEQIFKPYKDDINITSKLKDEIKDVDFFEFKNEEEYLAFGWIAKLQFLGSINRSNLFDCIRVRCGNIQVGDKNLLSEFFREERFNNYLIGELYITNNKLIPNSRRDDFEYNLYKEKLYISFIKEIGIPYSKRIRDASEKRSNTKLKNREFDIKQEALHIIQDGYYSENQKKKVINDLIRFKKGIDNLNDNTEINNLIENVNNTKFYFEKNHNKIKRKDKDRFKKILETIYDSCCDKSEAQKVINNIIKKDIFN